MDLTFLESGIDSLKKGFKNYFKYEELFYEEENFKKRFYYLKDSILLVQHGIEVLFKQILSNHSTFLLFSQIDDNVKSAFKEKREKKLNSVFETQLKHKIHTVTFSESIDRVKLIVGNELSDKLEKKLNEIEIYRNLIMHAEAHINENQIHETFEGLIDELDIFFYEALPDQYKTISGFSKLHENLDRLKQMWNENNQKLKAETIGIFHGGIDKANISLGMKEVKRITDINKATKFLDYVLSSKLKLGTDLYNGYCSGDVQNIKRIDEDLFSMYTGDNEKYYIFKFKSLIIYLPEISNSNSPLIFIEIADQNVDDNLEKYIFKQGDIELIDSLYDIQNQNEIFNFEKIERTKSAEDFNWNDYKGRTRFLTGGLFCFLNVMMLNYNHSSGSFIYKNWNLDGKKFQVKFRKAVNNN